MNRIATLAMFVLLFAASIFAVPVASTYAAPIGVAVEASGPVHNQASQLEAKITEITEQLTSVGRPLAILALVLVFISYIAEPALPDWAKESATRG